MPLFKYTSMAKAYNWGVNKTIKKDVETIDKLSALSQITFEYASEPVTGTYSCFTITAGAKYFIVKAKTCQWVEMHLNKLLKAYATTGIDSKDLYFPIVKYIFNSGYYDVMVNFICQSTNPYEVIKAEYRALQLHVGKSRCLNKEKIPYVPKYNPKTKMHGWLTVNQFLNFCRLVKKSDICNRNYIDIFKP